jgi:hypothetical protein
MGAATRMFYMASVLSLLRWRPSLVQASAVIMRIQLSRGSSPKRSFTGVTEVPQKRLACLRPQGKTHDCSRSSMIRAS